MARLLDSVTSHCEIYNLVGNHANQPRGRYNYRSPRSPWSVRTVTYRIRHYPSIGIRA